MTKCDNWISVTEQLPNPYTKVIAFDTQNGIHFDRFDGSGWIDKNVTHWMPLPEPPKEIKDGSPN